jgi:hypothetical protein
MEKKLIKIGKIGDFRRATIFRHNHHRCSLLGVHTTHGAGNQQPLKKKNQHQFGSDSAIIIQVEADKAIFSFSKGLDLRPHHLCLVARRKSVKQPARLRTIFWA